MPPSTLAHVTLTTGHVRASPRNEVAHDVIVLLAPLLSRALAGREVAVPGQACTMTGAHGEDCAVVTVWAAEDGAPLATIGMARGEDESARLWRLLHETAIGAPSVTHADHPPDAPWCGARLEVGLAGHMEAAHWLGDLERCLAWTWIESGGHIAQPLGRPPPPRRARGPRDAPPKPRRRN